MKFKNIICSFLRNTALCIFVLNNLVHNRQTYGAAADVPTPPNLQNLTETDAQSFRISWEAPEVIPPQGLTSYKIVITKLKEQFYVPFDCFESVDPVEVEMKPNLLEYRHTGAKGYTEYQVQVFAINEVGSSEGSNVQTVITSHKPSEPIRIVIVQVYAEWNAGDAYDVTVYVHWMLPCNSYGELVTYEAEFRGVRDGHEPHVISQQVPVDLQVMYPGVTLALRPDHAYNLTVWAKSDEFTGEPHVEPFRAPGGVPPPTGNVISPPIPDAVENEHKEALFEFSNNLFGDQLGDVQYYSIMLAQQGYEEKSTYGYWNLVNWPQVGNWTTDFEKISPYQCTPEFWNPFADGQNKTTIVLGTEQCTNGQLNCNGPLRPSTRYTIKVRGFTMGGYRDSVTVYFTTGENNAKPTTTEETTTDVTVIVDGPPDSEIVLIILCTSIGIMFTIAAIIFLYRNYIQKIHSYR